MSLHRRLAASGLLAFQLQLPSLSPGDPHILTITIASYSLVLSQQLWLGFVSLKQSLLQPGLISSSLWLKAGLELSTVLSTFIPSAGMTSVCCMISFFVFLLVSQCDGYP